MQIRRATSHDKKELVRLIKEFETRNDYLSEKQKKIRAFAHFDQMVETSAQKHIAEHITFVANEEGMLKGFVSGEIHEKKYRVYNKEGYISDWFVEEASRSQGVGKQLFDSLTEFFKKSGCTHIGLQTHLDNKKAIEIYEHMGFTKKLVTFFKPLKRLS
ncbi:GNAT family N-acetyltransferase [Candidatus Roizmanbacteria bacterium]|nr:GNAT family N-acetyltransferase [Candidatus Roizmanbacteria bacterium]